MIICKMTSVYSKLALIWDMDQTLFRTKGAVIVCQSDQIHHPKWCVADMISCLPPYSTPLPSPPPTWLMRRAGSGVYVSSPWCADKCPRGIPKNDNITFRNNVWSVGWDENPSVQKPLWSFRINFTSTRTISNGLNQQKLCYITFLRGYTQHNVMRNSFSLWLITVIISPTV